MYCKIYEPLLEKIQPGLEKIIGQSTTPVQRLTGGRTYILSVVDQLKSLLVKHPFREQSEEIEFFKRIKPAVYAYKIFEEEFYRVNLHQPIGPAEMIKEYLIEELNQVRRFFNLNDFHYQYFKLEATELDTVYFLREAQSPSIPIINSPDTTGEFSTAMDHLFARFIAYERLQNHLITEINALADPGVPRVLENRSAPTANLKWTGEAINLVELAYGIWLTGQLNDGNATITDIVQWLEAQFHVNIGRAYRRWTEISQRKMISSTKYLDQVKGAILKRIDDENSLKLQKRRMR